MTTWCHLRVVPGRKKAPEFIAALHRIAHPIGGHNLLTVVAPILGQHLTKSVQGLAYRRSCPHQSRGIRSSPPQHRRPVPDSGVATVFFSTSAADRCVGRSLHRHGDHIGEYSAIVKMFAVQLFSRLQRTGVVKQRLWRISLHQGRAPTQNGGLFPKTLPLGPA